MTEMDDRSVAARMAAGDEFALAALHEKWGGHVHSLAFWILQDADEAEDVVEETFWQAWRSAADYDAERATIVGWLLTIARCRALDRIRRMHRRAGRLAAASGASALGEGNCAGGPEPQADSYEDEERYGELAAALASLPAEQREALDLAFFTGLSHAQIAERLSQPLGTVKTRIRLAMQKLRQRLTYPDGGPGCLTGT